jgi:transcriptional regulator with XRE-family HTH domain
VDVMSQEVPALRSRRCSVRGDAPGLIRDARRRRGLTQRDLGILCGFSLETAQVQVSRMENGEGTMQSYLTAAACLEIPVTDMLEIREGA